MSKKNSKGKAKTEDMELETKDDCKCEGNKQEGAESCEGKCECSHDEERAGLAEKLSEVEKQLADLQDKHIRLMAEYDNYRKRTLKEKMELTKIAGEKIFVGILPVIDDFERALKHLSNSDSVDALKEGVELIYNKFIAFLGQNGVKVIETESQPFDAEIHEAITKVPAPSEDMKGKVIDCVEKGYMLDEKVIRFPKVVVGE